MSPSRPPLSRSRAALVALVAIGGLAAILLGASSPEPPKIAIYDLAKIADRIALREHDPFHGPEGDAKRAEIRQMMAELEAAGGDLDEEERVRREEAIRLARRELMALRPKRSKLDKERRDVVLESVVEHAQAEGYDLVYEKEFLKDTHGGLIDLRRRTDITDEVIEKLVAAGLAPEAPTGGGK